MDRKTKLSVVIDDYIAKRERKMSKETARVDRQILHSFLRHVRDKQIGNLTPEHVEDFFYGPQGIMSDHPVTQKGRKTNPPVSLATHNQYRGVLLTFFRTQMKKGLIKVDLMEEIPYRKPPKKQRLYLTPAQLLQLLDLADNPRDRALIAYALNTGNRASEIKNLRIEDIDLETGYAYPNIAKSKKGKVPTPITSDLAEELRTWLTIYANEIEGPLKGEYYLFPKRDGNLISHYKVDPDTGKRVPVRTPLVWVPTLPMYRLEDVVKKPLAKMGYKTKGEGIHTTRVAAGRILFDTAAVEEGDAHAIRTAMDWLNHSNQATTEIYLGTNADRVRKERMLKGKPFLSKLVDNSNVVPLKAVESA